MLFPRGIVIFLILTKRGYVRMKAKSHYPILNSINLISDIFLSFHPKLLKTFSYVDLDVIFQIVWRLFSR